MGGSTSNCRWKLRSTVITDVVFSGHGVFINTAHRQSQLLHYFYVAETYFTLPTNFGYCSNNRTETLWMVRLVTFLTQHNLGILFGLTTHLAHTTVRALPSGTHTWTWTYVQQLLELCSYILSASKNTVNNFHTYSTHTWLTSINILLSNKHILIQNLWTVPDYHSTLNWNILKI